MTRYALFFSVLTIAACTSERLELSFGGDSEVRFAAQMETVSADASLKGAGTRANDGYEKYLNLRFNSGDKIRIVNTTGSQQTPDFTDEGSYYEYEYKDEVSTDGYYVKCAFESKDKGFHWSDLTLSGAYYTLEAAFYPQKYEPSEYFKANCVPSDQGEAETLLQSDLMLAHHLTHVSEWGREIELKFHHVFSLMYVSLTVPSYDQATNTGFPKPDMEGYRQPTGCLTQLRTAYNINWHANIATDAVISVMADSDVVPVDEITMCPAGYDEDGEDVTYYFLGIVPTQNIDYTGTVTLCRFHLYDKAGNEKKYRFVPRDTPISIAQGNMTQIDLILPRAGVEPILIRAGIKPWNNAWSDMILEEE